MLEGDSWAVTRESISAVAPRTINKFAVGGLIKVAKDKE
jgi:hypothetical protein